MKTKKAILLYLLMIGFSPLCKSFSQEINIIFLKDGSKNCVKIAAVTEIIAQAIEAGAPTYNEGNHLGCYRIYEGAAYKILNKYGAKCKEVSNTLEEALEKSSGDYTMTEKAWIMRMAFDKILGVPTQTK